MVGECGWHIVRCPCNCEDLILTHPQRKFDEAITRPSFVHISACKRTWLPGNHAIVRKLLPYNQGMSSLLTSTCVRCIKLVQILSAVTPAFGQLSAVEARLEGEYRAGVNRVGRESEEVAYV